MLVEADPTRLNDGVKRVLSLGSADNIFTELIK
jgi:hypothetical protein